MVQAFLLEEANISYCARTVAGTEYDDFQDLLPESNKARAIGTALNVGSREAIHGWVTASAERFGRVDVVVANGTWHPAVQSLKHCTAAKPKNPEFSAR